MSTVTKDTIVDAFNSLAKVLENRRHSGLASCVRIAANEVYEQAADETDDRVQKLETELAIAKRDLKLSQEAARSYKHDAEEAVAEYLNGTIVDTAAARLKLGNHFRLADFRTPKEYPATDRYRKAVADYLDFDIKDLASARKALANAFGMSDYRTYKEQSEQQKLIDGLRKDKASAQKVIAERQQVVAEYLSGKEVNTVVARAKLAEVFQCQDRRSSNEGNARAAETEGRNELARKWTHAVAAYLNGHDPNDKTARKTLAEAFDMLDYRK